MPPVINIIFDKPDEKIQYQIHLTIYYTKKFHVCLISIFIEKM